MTKRYYEGNQFRPDRTMVIRKNRINKTAHAITAECSLKIYLSFMVPCFLFYQTVAALILLQPQQNIFLPAQN